MASCITPLKTANNQSAGNIPTPNSVRNGNHQDSKVPISKKHREQPQNEHAIKPLESKKMGNTKSDIFRSTSKKEQELENTIKKLKAANQKQIQNLVKKNRTERILLKKRLEQQAMRDKENYAREVHQMKRNYQDQLEHVRDIYHNQNVEMQNMLKDAFESQMKHMKKTYENARANISDDRLEKLERWLHDELVSGQLQQKTSQLEQTRAFYDFEINKLIQQLDEKDEDITFLEDKIREIAEEYLPENAQMDIFDELGLDDEDIDGNDTDSNVSERMKKEQN